MKSLTCASLLLRRGGDAMDTAKLVAKLLGAGIVLFASVGVAAETGLQFDIKVSGHVDCQSPEEYEDLPLAFKGQLTMLPSGDATAKLTMTAAYFVSFKSQVSARLGAPPVKHSDGTTTSFRVLNNNGLSMKLSYPTNDYTVNVAVDGKRCGAKLIAKLRPGEKYYSIGAGGTVYFCDRFEMTKSFCTVKQIKAK
ncbi:hypothetical protein [Devosia sp. CN2-171]|uniref:hypothetical protein n=1 Tax=Devosia sp. CN2-171 TaxID=3400909 RepID=UPI003BF7D33A